MIHMLLRMRYFKSINLFIGVILGYISPKASPKDCAIYGAHKWPKFFFYPPGEIVISSPCSYQYNLFSWVAGCLLIIWDVFHKTISSLFFSLLLTQQLRSTICVTVLSQDLVSLRSGDIVMLLSSTHLLGLSGPCFDRAYPFNRSIVSLFSSSFMLSSFSSLLNRSAVRDLSYSLAPFIQ